MQTLRVIKNPNLITASVVGLAWEPTLDAAGGLVSADDDEGAFLQHNTGTSPGSSGGVISSFDVVQLQGLEDDIVFEVKIDATPLPPPVGYGYWIGLFSQHPTTLANPSGPAEFAAFRLTDGAVVETVTSNTAAADNTVQGSTQFTPGELNTFRIRYDATGAGIVEFYWPNSMALYRTHDGNQANIHVPDPITMLGYGLRVISTGSGAQSIRWQSITINVK